MPFFFQMRLFTETSVKSLTILILGISALCAGQTPATFFSQKWGTTFHLKPTEQGDTISIVSLFSDGRQAYLYNLADRSLVVLDSSGAISASIPLTGSPSPTFAGDDFIIKDGQALFLNSIDRKILFFNATTGAFIKSIDYPQGLRDEPSRINRVINRIDIDGDRIVLGNGRRFFYLDRSLQKKDASAGILKAAAGQKIAGFNNGRKIICVRNSIYVNTVRAGTSIPTHFPVPGKRYAGINRSIYGLSLDANGVKILRVK